MKVGFVNGCFDILHIGHLRMLKHCRGLVDILVVAIDSDTRISKQKGSDRPYNNISDRKEMLSSLGVVDVVFSFETDKELETILKCLKPDIMMVGEEYKNKNVIGSEFAKVLKYFRRLDGYSTTKILQNTSGG